MHAGNPRVRVCDPFLGDQFHRPFKSAVKMLEPGRGRTLLGHDLLLLGDQPPPEREYQGDDSPARKPMFRNTAVGDSFFPSKNSQ